MSNINKVIFDGRISRAPNSNIYKRELPSPISALLYRDAKTKTARMKWRSWK